ncbi:hypothetical protein VTK56DRAFT_8363 [Thermocarpiscus australiensis]
MANLKIPQGSSKPASKNGSGGGALTPLSGASSTSGARPATSSAEESSDSSDGSDGSEESSQDESELSSDEDSELKTHLALLQSRPELDELNEIKTTPIFTEPVRKHARSVARTSKEKPFSQYGLLAGDLRGSTGDGSSSSDPRIFWNIAAPSSFFICGSQGSGKSHTLSCLLENALAPCEANVLPRPLTGIVFHYDTFISDSGGSPCEVAWLSSNPNIKVRVLCPPTNIRTMQRIYQRFPNIKVEELRLNESDLNTQRMLDLMAVTAGGNLPLYLHVAQRILRDLRVEQQKTGSPFSYSRFKQALQLENLTEMQLAPLKQRLDTLESFMVEDQAKAYNMFGGGTSRPESLKSKKSKKCKKPKGTSWTPHASHLTIVDLSCPCVTPEMACSLFHICLSLFLEQDPTAVGRIVALDEAHKYMTGGSSSSTSPSPSPECQALTEALLATIRLQRHLGARVVVSTQEPTVSAALLDLCSVTVVHRFTSPAWLAALRRHLAGVSAGGRLLERARRSNDRDGEKEEDGEGEGEDGEEEDEGAGTLTLGEADPALELFSRIVDLRVGEALLFAPSAIVGVRKKIDPLLYDFLIRRFQTPAEREAEGRAKGYARVLEGSLLRGEERLARLRAQTGAAAGVGVGVGVGIGQSGAASTSTSTSVSNGAGPSLDSTSAAAAAGSSRSSNGGGGGGGGSAGEVTTGTTFSSLAAELSPPPKTKEEGRAQWEAFLRDRFIRGEDDDFDYAAVDEDDEYDVLEREEREEAWFEDEEPEWATTGSSSSSGAEEERGGERAKPERVLKGETGIQDF